MILDYIALASKTLDWEFIKKHTIKLNELEKSTSHGDFKASTQYVLDIMREANFSDIERYALPCDGKTAYDDCVMPMAWDRSGRCTLEIIEADSWSGDRMLADSDKELLNAVIWSPPTPPEGVTAELISLKSIGEDNWHELDDKIVLCHTSPRGDLLRRIAQSGALGLVSYEESLLGTNPDDVRWMNGCGWCGWYYTADDQALWNYSITPRVGDCLQKKLENGEKFVLKAIMNTKVYSGEIYTVTGRIPGESSGEIALLAHMYEPFLADDASGVVLSIAIGKALREMVVKGLIPPLEKSIRVVFSMERYGFSEYFHNMKNSRRIITAVNMDSVCHTTLELAGVLPELRHSPASAPFFGATIIREYLAKHYPELPFQETPGNLSDDTFGADSPFNIPTLWFHTPPAIGRHHNSGEIFAGIDWQIARNVAEIMTSYLAVLALVKRGRGDKALLKKIFKQVKADAADDFKRLKSNMLSDKVNSYGGNVIGDFLADYHTRRVMALNLLVPGAVKASEIRQQIASLRKKHAPESEKTDIYELTNSEQRMAYMTVKRDEKVRQIMSMSRLPEAERYGFIAKPTMLLCALLDGKRNLYEAYIISNFMLKRNGDFKETAGLVSFFRKMAQYGYYSIEYAESLTAQDLLAALKALDVKSSDKLVVHSSYGSLGGVEGGPATVVETLINHCGKKGLLMMPSFNFPYYMKHNDDEFFDIRQTPSCVGVITDEFRRHKDVFRSLNPSHSIAVYGKKNFHWVSDHHKTLTMGQDSPLGKLESAEGYALMISCPDSVTFMHVVEMTNQVHCLGRRSEEFNTKLPDGSIKKIRTWGWRASQCMAYNRKAIFDYLREHGLITEVMVRHSLWQFFKLSDYRKAYLKSVMHAKFGCMQCQVLPRKVENTCISDWHDSKNSVRSNTTAFTGDWEYKKGSVPDKG